MSADRNLFEAWTRAWAISRSVAPPVPHGSGVRIEVGRPDQRERYVFPTLDAAEFGALAASINVSAVFLKVCTAEAEVAPLLPRRWRVQAPGTMMAARLALQETALPNGYGIAVAADGAMRVATVTDAAGAVAARGHLIFQSGFAIFDRIRTEPAHERRGLGRALMRALTAVALDLGAARGVLVATPAGRRLYAALGWSVHSPYTTAVIP